MRKKKHGAERIEACSELLIKTLPVTRDGAAADCGRGGELRLEIGCGKGAFIRGTAVKEPDVNFLALERCSDVAMIAMEKCKAAEIPNVRFMIGDVAKLAENFTDGSIDRIYLNFSDPWPKDRQANRRLTSPVFMKIYQQFLKQDGDLEFKTDNEGLFDYSLLSIPEAGWTLTAVTRDLHHDERMNQGNIMTEYEEKFSAKGNPIFKLIATPPVHEA